MAVLDYLQKICCFLVVTEILMQLKPSKKYEKYLKMTVGLICLGIVLLPVGKALNGGNYVIEPDSVTVFEEKLYQALEEGSLEATEETESQRKLYETEEGQLLKEQSEALKEQMNGAVQHMNYEIEDMGVTDEKFVVTLKDVSGVIKVTAGSEEEKMKEIIAEELGVDENAITVVIK